jgi:hypothetical protein
MENNPNKNTKYRHNLLTGCCVQEHSSGNIRRYSAGGRRKPVRAQTKPPTSDTTSPKWGMDWERMTMRRRNSSREIKTEISRNMGVDEFGVGITGVDVVDKDEGDRGSSCSGASEYDDCFENGADRDGLDDMGLSPSLSVPVDPS